PVGTVVVGGCTAPGDGRHAALLAIDRAGRFRHAERLDGRALDSLLDDRALSLLAEPRVAGIALCIPPGPATPAPHRIARTITPPRSRRPPRAAAGRLGLWHKPPTIPTPQPASTPPPETSPSS